MFLYAVIGLRVLRIRLAMTSRFWPRSIRHLTGLFSFHRTPSRRSTSLFYSMTFPNTERIPIRSHWPSATPYPPGDDKQILATINSPPDRTVLFPSDTKLTIHSIVLFYDLSQHRAYSYTQSLAFGYSVST